MTKPQGWVAILLLYIITVQLAYIGQIDIQIIGWMIVGILTAVIIAAAFDASEALMWRVDDEEDK